METRTNKNEILFIMVLIIILLISIYKNNSSNTRPGDIKEIHSASQVSYDHDSGKLSIEKAFVVNSPPEEIDERMELIQNFYRENSGNLLETDMGLDSVQDVYMFLWFYKESPSLNETWVEDSSHMDPDSLNHHLEESIGIIRKRSGEDKIKFTARKFNKKTGFEDEREIKQYYNNKSIVDSLRKH